MQALYSKYRPQNFDEVIGQDHISVPLKKAVSDNKFSHAFLFSGTRGTGKTSVARILSREIGTDSNDLYEIDAASHTGVDDMREILESVETLPLSSEYKVYILDEVHMLSKSAFNALLKTLEEPPHHAIFILATTEPDKVPETIRSRCEVYTFREPNELILKEVVENISKKEKVKLDKGVSELVAKLGNGSFRDTLSHLQKVISLSDDEIISREEVENITGIPSGDLVMKWLKAYIVQDSELYQEVINDLSSKQKDAKIFTELLIEKFRVMLLVKVGSLKMTDVTFCTDSEIESMNILISENGEGIDSIKLRRLLSAYTEISSSPKPYIPLELAFIESLEV